MNPYEVLGVARDAAPDEIKKVYRRLARETHPDLNPGDAVAETRFKQVSTAYDILSDEKKRRAYDEFGEISLEAGFDADKARAARDQFEARFGSPDDDAFGEGFAFGGIDDLLRGFGAGRGGRGGPRFAMRGSDVEASMSLGFVEAVRGGEKRLHIARPRADGGVIEEDVTVRIPPGVTDGGRLRIPGKGGEGHGGAPAGDLWIRVRVEPHPVFRVSGRDLEFDLPIRVAEAIAGARVEVPTLDGRATLTIPPGTSSHARLRLRGQGVPAAGGQPAGDLYARIKIVVPKQIDDETRAAIERIEQDDPRKGLF
ncbi:MAG: J domain-containing protein [Spirochaetaceae bacterium]|nr:J domain-containing protein [Myxococcales bacterium]MCB9725864.1 J domain-containing protein [Spirochaetaceae bacterium]